MTAGNINLTQLRKRAKLARDEFPDWHAGIDFPEGVIPASPSQVLALIDTVEAAIEYLEQEYGPIDADYEFPLAVYRLRETLNHYTTTPTP